MRERRSARECALGFLERCDRTESEIRRKLREREYLPEEIDAAVAFLKEYRYVDDAEYVRRYIRVYAVRKSTRQIRCALEQKGVDRELIAAGLEDEPVDEEEQVRRLLLKKGYRPGERMEADQYRKLTASLCRRGFSYEVIRRVTSRMCEEENWG